VHRVVQRNDVRAAADAVIGPERDKFGKPGGKPGIEIISVFCVNYDLGRGPGPVAV